MRASPHSQTDSTFTIIGEIFSAETNKDRKNPFNIRPVNAVVDAVHQKLERRAGKAHADTSVVVEAHLGGYPVSVIGSESQNVPRIVGLDLSGPDRRHAAIWPCSVCLPWHAEVIHQGDDVFVREWHAVDCETFYDLIKRD